MSDLPALAGAERLLLMKAGVKQEGVRAMRQLLARRMEAWEGQVQARIESAVEVRTGELMHRLVRYEDVMGEHYESGYEDGRAIGYKSGVEEGSREAWEQQLEAGWAAHLLVAHQGPYWCCDRAPCSTLTREDRRAIHE